MSQEPEKMILREKYRGVFGEFEVYGFRDENGAGELIWRTSSAPSSGGRTAHEYQLRGGELHKIRYHHVPGQKHDTRLVCEEVAEVEAKEKQAIFDAIRQWEA